MQSVANLSNISAPTLEFYRNVMQVLNSESAPYLVGGAYALNCYTGLERHTKDFDIFIKRDDYESISRVLDKAGYTTELTYPHWLAKAHHNGDFIDLVFSSGNGIADVDQAWFDHAHKAQIFDIPTRVCPAEEIIWSKAFIMERERFDGADIAHLILVRGAEFNWQRLMQRFDPHWRLLLSHLVLFGFIYPAHRDVVPSWVMENLLDRLQKDLQSATPIENVCAGTLLSREQYLNDIGRWGYNDARLPPYGKMTEQDTAKWTQAIKH